MSARKSTIGLLSLMALLALGGGVYALRQVMHDDGPPPLPAATPVGGVTLIEARPFTLDVPYTHDWRAERPQVTAGVLLVLGVDPDLVHPRQGLEPVLYVGDQTVERINFGGESGHVVAVVPAPVDGQGHVALDLSRTPIYFGTPALPEQVDAATVAQELAAAQARGIAPPTAAAVAAVSQPEVRFHDSYDVRVFAADLIEAWSPMETDLVSGLRAPLVGK
jgi:hypothetical protein